jgi:hypothetical protein
VKNTSACPHSTRIDKPFLFIPCGLIYRLDTKNFNSRMQIKLNLVTDEIARYAADAGCSMSNSEINHPGNLK